MPKSWSHGLFFNTDTDSKDRCNHNIWRKTLDGTEVHAQSSFLLLALHARMQGPISLCNSGNRQVCVAERWGTQGGCAA